MEKIIIINTGTRIRNRKYWNRIKLPDKKEVSATSQLGENPTWPITSTYNRER